MAQELIVSEENTNSRLDVYLAKVLPDLVTSRRQARSFCREKLIKVNGYKESPGYLLRAGDRVQVGSSVKKAEARAELGKSHQLEVLYEDEHFLGVFKPREMHSVTNSISDSLTLADALLAYNHELKTASPDPRESGLVQRLDYYTSGVILAAKSRNSWSKIREELFSHRVNKTYLALVEGDFPEDEIETRFLMTQSNNSKKMEINEVLENSPNRDVTISYFKKVETIKDLDLTIVRSTIALAKRHQVRAHLGTLGYPLLGDELYGARKPLSIYKKNANGFLLLAESISFKHPLTNKKINIKAKINFENL